MIDAMKFQEFIDRGELKTLIRDTATLSHQHHALDNVTDAVIKLCLDRLVVVLRERDTPYSPPTGKDALCRARKELPDLIFTSAMCKIEKDEAKCLTDSMVVWFENALSSTAPCPHEAKLAESKKECERLKAAVEWACSEKGLDDVLMTAQGKNTGDFLKTMQAELRRRAGGE